MKHTFDMDDVKAGISKSLPMLEDIKDKELSQKVIDAWAYALTENGYASLEELPGLHPPEGPAGTLSSHLLGVARISRALVEIAGEVTGSPIAADRDLLIACGLCHELGRPFACREESHRQRPKDADEELSPTLRHTLYGVHVALLFRLPETVAQTCGRHALDDRVAQRTLLTELVHCADQSYGVILESTHRRAVPHPGLF